MSYRYQPFYCEENAIGLLTESPMSDSEPWLVLISNANRQVMMFAQAAGQTDGVVVWDYHAVVVTRVDKQIWDLDTIAGFPLAVDDYLAASFGAPALLPEMWQPRFRVFSRDTVQQEFSSDRSHMLDEDGNYLAPPPSWAPLINGPNTLMSWTDMTGPAALTREQFLAWAAN